MPQFHSWGRAQHQSLDGNKTFQRKIRKRNIVYSKLVESLAARETTPGIFSAT